MEIDLIDFSCFTCSLFLFAYQILSFFLQNKRRREEEEYYASQQAGYVAPPPKEKKKWYQKFRRNKKEGRDSPAIQLAAQDESVGGDFAQMQDDDDRSMGNGSLGGWSARSWNNRTYA